MFFLTYKSLRAYVGAFEAKQDTSWVFDLGWVCWESLPPPATSETNSFIQLSLKEIFGGCRSVACSFSYMTFPDFIMIAFGIQYVS